MIPVHTPLPKIPLGSAVEVLIEWIQVHLHGFLSAISRAGTLVNDNLVDLLLAVPPLLMVVVFVLIAVNVGHVKSVSAMTGENLDDLTGRALFADGLSTMLAGAGGGSGTTTYAENIGVMAATRVYSTAAYLVAACCAFLLSLMPKFGALIATIPSGVLGGAGTVLYGMIGMLGVRIWVQNRVDFANPVNLNTAAIALIVAIADFTWNISGMTFGGIALGTAAAIIVYHGMRGISKLRGTNLEQASPASAPAGSELESEPYASRHRSTQA